MADYYWRELFIHSRFLLCHIPQHYIFIPFCLVYLAVESVWKHSHISLLPISTDRQSGLSTSYLRMKRKKNFTTFILLSSIQFFSLVGDCTWRAIRAQLVTSVRALNLPPFATTRRGPYDDDILLLYTFPFMRFASLITGSCKGVTGHLMDHMQ